MPACAWSKLGDGAGSIAAKERTCEAVHDQRRAEREPERFFSSALFFANALNFSLAAMLFGCLTPWIAPILSVRTRGMGSHLPACASRSGRSE